MRKNYLFLFIVFFSFQICFSQSSLSSLPLLPQNLLAKYKPKKKHNKSAGDTLYYQDFGGQLPSGWSTIGLSNPTHVWQWSNSAPGGQYSTNVTALQSPSSANGYLLLPSDLYNTPTPANGFVNVNSSITSPAIAINSTPSVHLTLYQSQRFCCTQANSMYVEVSADSVNWTVFPLTKNRTAEASSINGEFVKINVSAVLGNQSQAYLRFVQNGASQYYWMIDDVALLEGPRNQLEISKLRMTGVDSFSIEPHYLIRPHELSCPTMFWFDVENIGSTTVTNAYCVSTLRHDSTISGLPGVGLLYTDTSYVTASINPTQRIYSSSPVYDIQEFGGYYTFKIECKADSSFNISAIDSISYESSDTVLSKGRATTLSESFGTHQFLGGGNDSDFVGTLFNLTTSATVSSLSFYIPNDVAVVGAQLTPVVHRYIADSSNLNNAFYPVAESLVPTTISSAMLGSWQNFDFMFGTGPALLTSGQYVAGYKIYNPSGSPTNMLIGRDIEVEAAQTQHQSLVFLNGSLSEWRWISQVPAVSIYIEYSGPFSGIFTPCSYNVSQKEMNKKESKLSIYPNPTFGELNLRTTDIAFQNTQILIFDLSGKQVYRQTITESSDNELRLHLDQLKNGLYVIQIRTKGQFFNEKLLIHK